MALEKMFRETRTMAKDLKQIQNAIKYIKPKPFKEIKFVVHKPPPKKMTPRYISQFMKD